MTLQAEPDLTPPASPPPRRRRGRLVAVVVLVVLGVVCIAGGAVTLVRELTRSATKSEIAAAQAEEIATRWERLPAGTIFPARISYQNEEGVATSATLVGIAPQTSCQAALAPAAYAKIRSLGCKVMLRATYLDASGTLVTTIGIAEMPSPLAASSAQGDLVNQAPSASLDAVPFAGTTTADFGDAQRGAAGAQYQGPYLFVYTAGYTDGLPGRAAAGNLELGALGGGVLGAIEPVLIRHGSTCSEKDIKC
jgi:hypothetical protein